jgi:glycogen synthase
VARPVRILSVGNMYPPHHQGGYELVWQSANQCARDSGHSVRVLVSAHRDRAVTEPDEPDVHRTLRWYWDWDRYAFERLPIATRIRIERANAAELRRHLQAFQPDVVAWWSMGHMSLGLIEQVRRAGIPAMLSIHNDWLVYGPKADQWTRLWLDRSPVLAAAADRALGLPTVFRPATAGRLVFNSRYSLRAAEAAGIASTDTEIIHPGINEEFTHPAPARPWRWRLLYVGRIDRGKGVDTAVAALQRLPEAELAIHGKGDAGYTDELRSLARDIGAADRVTFGEFTNPEGLRRAYADADAVLFPVRWQEPWGLVPLEAMGMGRPVISTAVGGTAEFLCDGENALVVRPDDPAAVAAAVRRLADDEGLRRSLVQRGIGTAARHTAADSARRTVEAIIGAAGLPRGRAGQIASA